MFQCTKHLYCVNFFLSARRPNCGLSEVTYLELGDIVASEDSGRLCFFLLEIEYKIHLISRDGAFVLLSEILI